jgi:hypothetical protein
MIGYRVGKGQAHIQRRCVRQNLSRLGFIIVKNVRQLPCGDAKTARFLLRCKMSLMTDAVEKGKMNRSKFLTSRPSKPVFRNPMHRRELTKAAGWKSN